MKIFLVILGLLVLSFSFMQEGEAFTIVGPRPLGMGGAFVAVTEGAESVYWNPASLGQREKFEFLALVGISAVDQISDFVEEINEFNDNPPEVDWQFALKLKGILEKYDKEGIAAFGDPSLMFFFHKSPFALSLMGLGIFGVIADLDLSDQYLVEDDTPGNNYGWDDNPSKIVMGALTTIDLAFSYAYSFNPEFSVGGNLKYIKAQKYDNEFILSEESEEGEEGSAWLDKVKEKDPVKGNGFGIDLGFLYQFKEKWRTGLLLRNLIEPNIKWEDDSESTKLSNQIRVGVAYMPLERLTLALDFDLNKEEILSEERQQVSLGAEWWASKFFALRIGGYNNNGKISDNFVFTGGVGLQLARLSFDLGGAMDSEQKEAAVSTSLSLKF